MGQLLEALLSQYIEDDTPIIIISSPKKKKKDYEDIKLGGTKDTSPTTVIPSPVGG